MSLKPFHSFCLFFFVWVAIGGSALAVPSARDPSWLKLLHYHNSILSSSGWRSQVVDASFFSSSVGRDDPEQELQAALIAAQQPAYACQFPARYQWLRSQSTLPDRPPEQCLELNDWLQNIRPSKAVLVFPTSFLNNPASTFGHTLLRIDPAQKQPSLISYAANFAAFAGPDNAIVYASKGIFGGYNGYFSVGPYYQKVTQYNDLENRDIWEFDLSFTPQEVKFMTLHLWELKEKAVTYYYFDENCSYQILALLEAVRPELNLLEASGTWVLPIDTIRTLQRQPGLVQNAHYRPSAATIIKSRLAGATEDVRALALALLSDSPQIIFDQSKLSASEKAPALELAYETILYRRRKGIISEASADSIAWKLLQLRAALPSTTVEIISPTPAEPDTGHRSLRVTSEFGGRNGKSQAVLGFQPALHDLQDPQKAFLRGSQLKFAALDLRVKEDAGLDVEQATFVDVLSLSPRDNFFQPTAWQMHFGMDRGPVRDQKESLRLRFFGGLGGAWQPNSATTFALMGAPELRSDDDLNPAIRGGVGPQGLLVSYPSEWMSLFALSGYRRFWNGADSSYINLESGVGFSLSQNLGLRAGYNWQREFSTTDRRWYLSLAYYFNPP